MNSLWFVFWSVVDVASVALFLSQLRRLAWVYSLSATHTEVVTQAQFDVKLAGILVGVTVLALFAYKLAARLRGA